EFKVRDELTERRKEINTFNELVDFLEDIKEHYNFDYGAAPRAIAQACLAVGYYLSKEFGITGFQAGAVMWDFVMGWTSIGRQVGAKILDYDKMLYPQYQHEFEKTIDSDTWERLQKFAADNIKDKEFYSLKVMDHWQSIVDGVVPFGYTVKD
ncbi:MAG: hypothetical protein NC452_19725, partial [Eubacterium sp.]|nr:hypothetical protein [Eubacterium sp.]